MDWLQGSDAFAKLVQDDYAKFGKLVRELNIKVQ